MFFFVSEKQSFHSKEPKTPQSKFFEMTDINSVQFSEYLKNALEKQLVLLSYCAWQATILCELYTYCYGTDGVIDRRDEESTNTERHRARMIAPRGGFPEFR